jgi:monomeric isocitrate dehydrogenase
MIHHTHVRNYPGSLEELAGELGDLRYDALAEFLELLADKIRKDGDKDRERQRRKLAASLHCCADELMNAKKAIDRAWAISEPYM